MEPKVVSRCLDWRPQVPLEIRPPRVAPIRIVVAFHPLRSDLGVRLRRIIRDWSQTAVGLIHDVGNAVQLQVAYKNHGRALRVLARRGNLGR